LFKDFIEDGHWKSVRENDQTRLKTASVPKHNKFSDTIFGQIALRQLNNGSSVSPGIY